MDKESQWINEWIALLNEADAALSARVGYPVDRERMKELTVQWLGSENELHLLRSDLPTSAALVDALIGAADSGLLRGSLQTIELDEGVLPPEIPQLVLEQVLKAGGEVWRIHKYDADPFPSSPHAHLVGTSLKLHLGTGELFEKRKQNGSISCKDLKAIREKVRPDIGLPENTCK